VRLLGPRRGPHRPPRWHVALPLHHHCQRAPSWALVPWIASAQYAPQCGEHAGAIPVTRGRTGGELSPVNGEPASGSADRWGRLTRRSRLSVPQCGVGWCSGVYPAFSVAGF
jgi:hypothetical protein